MIKTNLIMKLLLKSKTFLFFSIILFSTGVLAQDIPEPMYPYRLVNDFAEVFTSAENSALEQKLLAYNDSNGAVILIKPKIGNSRGQAFIATGYGLEARINDAYAGRIVRNEMIPYFITDDYFGGVNAAVDAMIARLSGEYDADAKEDEGISIFAIIIVLIVMIVLLSIFFGGGDQNIGGDGHHKTTMPPIFFPPQSGKRSGVFGGGFGGGGFGGGGGGRFGGGGAGGSW